MAAKIQNRAVVEDHAPEEVEEDTPERKRWRALNWFATPPWGARAGAELVLEIDPAAGSFWESACGDGIMAAAIRDMVPGDVFQSDLELQPGPGQSNEAFQHDFLLDDGGPEVDWIFTNPPFKHAEEFVRVGLRKARRGVAVLCRLSFLETSGRYAMHFTGQEPLTILAPFLDRLPIHLGPWQPDADTMTAYAWFLYRKAGLRIQEGHQPPPPIIRPVPPGSNRRLQRDSDVQKFVVSKPGSLL